MQIYVTSTCTRSPDSTPGNWTGWSPRGVTPIQVEPFRRGKRHQILPAYSQDGVVLAKVFQGSTDTAVFEDFLEQLLPLCGRWPEPKSVLIMDNASFHRSARIKRMCQEASLDKQFDSSWPVIAKSLINV